jgi:hypothetical protein
MRLSGLNSKVNALIYGGAYCCGSGGEDPIAVVIEARRKTKQSRGQALSCLRFFFREGRNTTGRSNAAALDHSFDGGLPVL